MPGRRVRGDPIDDTLCRRCQAEKPAITVRTEPLCKACFAKYVQTKVVKRMESFRVRNSDPSKPRKLLLSLDFDACSLGLLQVLSQHAKGQVEKTGRAGYTLCVVHIASDANEKRAREAKIARLKAQFLGNEYHTAAISDILKFEDLSSLFTGTSGDSSEGKSLDQSLDDFLQSLKSATARQDTLKVLQQRLIVQLAKEHGCEAVLWPDSTTRLAQRTLAETAKGRGYTLPWVVADGESPHGIPFYFPMRELLTHEVEAYISFFDPPFEDGFQETQIKPVVGTKNTTIDDLMAQYFGSVEKEFPSIVANVVRTTGKLQASSLSQIEQQCELCNMPLEERAPERSRLCYGCVRNTAQEVGP